MRDRTLLLLGGANALRRAELVAFDAADRPGGGVELPILRERLGSCPVAAVET